ncbi:carbonic anhydrase XVb [Megalops cyprinoides]|uniref:carbonic anhydrase XVb n=1 Tax=Megalops cyprinoides TaxID=118141 RepID=UPI001863C3A0|nr:carbonic anhydrase XVb [Megalops cyprinoides]
MEGATKMTTVLASLAIFTSVLMPVVHSASEAVAWCYHEHSCNDTVWVTVPYGVCNGTRQSPIDIITASVQGDASLTAFTFNGFSNNTALKKISNTGDTVKVEISSGLVSVAGGGLPTSYDSLQFHLHWGNTSSTDGSEHTVDGKGYPMELHIVNIKSEFNGNTTLAVKDPEGLAALGFFIEASNDIGLPESWKSLTSYLKNITNKGDQAYLQHHISLDDLLVGVDRTKYYRYLGSLTTPLCQEAVVWTVFKDPIKVSKDLIDLFSTTVYFNTSSESPLMTNVYRSIQPLNGRVVKTQATASTSAGSNNSHTLGLLCFALLPLFWRE